MNDIGHDASSPLRRVNREWARLHGDPAACRRASTWNLLTEPVDDLDRLIDLVGPDDPERRAEPALHQLVALARTDDLATRIVLQRLLPDLVRVHRRRSWQGWTDVGLGDLLATGWIAIRTYNPARRPSRLAASLVSDVEYNEYRAALRRRGQHLPVDPVGFERLTADDDHDAATELQHLLVEGAHLLTADEHDLLRRLLSGRMAIDIAAELGVTPRTLRNRRDRIAVKLRAIALAA
ncbi:MAG: hypothetical protein ACO3D0_08950 [Ilumatobacteraceae bacterium]